MVKLELTELGETKAREIPNNIAHVLNHHLRGFSADEVQQLKHFMMRMLANGSACSSAPSADVHAHPRSGGFSLA